MPDKKHQNLLHQSSTRDKATADVQHQESGFEELVQHAITNPDNLKPKQILQLQRTMGNRAVIQMLRNQQAASGANGLIQREPIKTTFGTFNDEDYTAVDDDGSRGVSMTLSFEPNNRVNAEQIGMVQSVKSYENGAPITLDPGQEGRMVEDGPAAGFKTDRLTGQNNPVYGSPELEEGKDLTDTPETDAPGKEVGSGEDDAKYQLGYHYYEKSGGLKTQNAEMYDKPQLYQPPANSGQEFETTALALSGNDKDAYYGSVRWGWQTDKDGKFTQLPLSKVSDAIPSANFIEAAKKWNEFSYESKISTPDSNGIAVVKVPMIVEVSGNAFTLAAGSLLKIDIKSEPIGGQLLVTLQEPILIEDGEPYWMTWVKTTDIVDDKLPNETTLEKDGKSFKVAAGTEIKSTGSVVADTTLVYIKKTTIVSADVSHRIAWAKDYDIFGRETADLPIPGAGAAVWSWMKWATEWE